MAKELPVEIFMPPNILKAKLGNRGLDPSLIERAVQAIEEIKGEFGAWIAEDVRRLAEARAAYEQHSDDQRLGSLYRAAHDLKGQAATFDFPLVARVASSLCQLTEDAACGPGLPHTLIDAHVDAIRVIVRDGVKDPQDKLASTLVAELERQVGHLRRGVLAAEPDSPAGEFTPE